MFKKILKKILVQEKGQGLVEYALILVLVAIIVIAILLTLGPTVGQVYCKVANGLQPGSCSIGSGPFTLIQVEPGAGNQVDVTFTVSKPTTGITINVTNGIIPGSPPTSCSGSCSFSITGAGSGSHGAVTIYGGDGSISGAW